MRWAVLVAAALAALAGCSGTDGGDEDFDAIPPYEEDFEDPAYIDDWDPVYGSWVLRERDGNAVLEGVGDADAGHSFYFVTRAGSFQDFEASVRFRVTSQGADGVGLAFNAVDEEDTLAVRYSPANASWQLVQRIDGKATVVGPAAAGRVAHAADGWLTLRVVSEGGTVRAYDGGTEVLVHALPLEASHFGRLGLYLAEDSRADFDDVRAQRLEA